VAVEGRRSFGVLGPVPAQEGRPLESQDFVRRVAEQAHVREGEARRAVAATALR
jgi:hypothetical protein